MAALPSALFGFTVLGSALVCSVTGCSASDGTSGETGGSETGGGDTSGTGGTPGSGGSALGSGGASSGGSGGSATSGGSTGYVACPADAYFCADFETDGMPTGSTYHPDYRSATWTSYMSIQGTTVKNGQKALEVNATDTSQFNILATPVASSTFWARFYLQSTLEIGQATHNSYVAAMTGNGEPNTGDNMEVSEQYCQMVLNIHDTVTTSIGGTTQCGTGVPPLTANEWHCIEVQFDGPGGIVQVFADNSAVIDKTGQAAISYATFGFGFFGFNSPGRTLYYDDVAVGPTRPGCPTP